MKGKSLSVVLAVAFFTGVFCPRVFCASNTLVITEVIYSFAANEAGQYVEIYNKSNSSVNLSNISIQFSGTTNVWGTAKPLGNYILGPHDYFLVSNRNPLVITIQGQQQTITPNLYINATTLYSKPTLATGPARGIRLLGATGNVIDCLIYGKHTGLSLNGQGVPITNPSQLDPDGFYTSGDILTIPTVNIDGLDASYAILRKTSAGNYVDTDQGSADFEITLNLSPQSGTLLPPNPVTAQNFSAAKTSSGFLMSWVVQYATSYKIYWKNEKADPWTEVSSSNPDITYDSGTGLLSWIDRTINSITLKKRYYKVTARQ